MSLYLVLACLHLASALTNSDLTCIAENPGTLDNQFLVGVWYEIYQFGPRLDLPSTSACFVNNITRASAEDIENYRAAYGTGGPFQFDSTAVLLNRFNGIFKGMITGDNHVKFFVWDPKSVFFGTEPYEARVYKRVNDEYMLFNTCPNCQTLWLLSRRKNQTEAELREVISTIDKVKNLQKQRYCAGEPHLRRYTNYTCHGYA